MKMVPRPRICTSQRFHARRQGNRSAWLQTRIACAATVGIDKVTCRPSGALKCNAKGVTARSFSRGEGGYGLGPASAQRCWRQIPIRVLGTANPAGHEPQSVARRRAPASRRTRRLTGFCRVSKPIEIRCPIYGFIPLDGWEHDVVETPEIRRLRRIRQLAWTDYVYPGAMHTRFEHTLGVTHMVWLLFKQLTLPKTISRTLIVEHFGGNDDHLPRYEKILRLAALLHDVGHSPFSHGGEELFPWKNDDDPERFEHEDYSASIILHRLRSVIDDHPRNAYGIRAEEVAALILGSAEAGPALFWRPLISGQLDADRMDYLLRDSHHAGVQYGRYDWHRIINTATVAPPDQDRGARLGVTEGGWNAAEGLIVARYMMFNQVYYHKTRVILDFHLQQALSEILPDACFPRPAEATLQAYLEWDDWRVLGALAAGHGGDAARRLRERDLFREIRHTPAYPEKRDDRLLDRWRKQLGGILTADIPSERSWYKVDNTDIPVVTEDAKRLVRPLSYYSPIVKKMETMRQVRLYVKPEDRENAEQRLAKVERRKK